MLQILSFLGGYDLNFTYLIWCQHTRVAALVDAATPVQPILKIIKDKGLDLRSVYLTHTHADHLACLDKWMASYPQLRVLGHERPVQDGLPNYRGLPDGIVMELGCCRITMIETPGHHPDCVCWYHEEGAAIFTGDTIFVGRTGRTIGPLSSVEVLYHSVYERILTLPSETRIYPGHDYGSTHSITLDELKAGSQFFQCTSAAQFIEVMAHYEQTRRIGE